MRSDDRDATVWAQSKTDRFAFGPPCGRLGFRPTLRAGSGRAAAGGFALCFAVFGRSVALATAAGGFTLAAAAGGLALARAFAFARAVARLDLIRVGGLATFLLAAGEGEGTRAQDGQGGHDVLEVCHYFLLILRRSRPGVVEVALANEVRRWGSPGRRSEERRVGKEGGARWCRCRW